MNANALVLNSGYLAVSDLARCEPVCKQWKAIAEEARKTFPGVNAGFLYQLTAPNLCRGYFYDCYKNGQTADVLRANPLLHAVFKKVQRVVFVGKQETDFEAEKNLKMKEEIIANFKERHSSEEIQTLLVEAYRHLSTRLSPKQFAAFRSHTKKITDDVLEFCLAALYCLSSDFGNREFDPFAYLFQRAAKKNHSEIETETDFPTLIAFFLDLIKNQGQTPLIQLPSISPGSQQAWLQGHDEFSGISSPQFPPESSDLEMMNKLLSEVIDDYMKQMRTFEEAGHSLLRCEEKVTQAKVLLQGATTLQRVQKERIDHQLRKKDEQIKAYQQQTDRFEAIGRILTQQARQIAEKIAASLDETLFVANRNSFLPKALKDMGIGVYGPLRVPTKPIGLLWKVWSPQRKVGHLIGTLHLTPTQLCFNQRFIDTIRSSRAFALETNVTRKDVQIDFTQKTKSQVEKTLAQLSSEEKKNLVTLAKTLLKKIPSPYEKLPESDDDFLALVLPLFEEATWSGAGMVPGIDFQCLKIAEKEKIPVYDLERASMHNDLLCEYDSMLNLEYLKKLSTLNDLQADALFSDIVEFKRKSIQNYMRKWEIGIAEEWEQMERKRSRTEANQKIMCKRNIEMAAQFHALVSDDKRPTGAVGAAHLFGDYSILKILKQQYDYESEQIICEEPDLQAAAAMQQRI